MENKKANKENQLKVVEIKNTKIENLDKIESLEKYYQELTKLNLI